MIKRRRIGLARIEQRRPVHVRRMAVHQIGVGIGRHVGQIDRTHAHFAPGHAVGDRIRKAAFADIVKKLPDGAPLEIVIVAHQVDVAEDRLRIFEGPVGEHHRIVAVVVKRLAVLRIDDQRAVGAGLLLKAGMAVVPVGAGLFDPVAVMIGFSRLDAGEVHARHTVHGKRHQDTVPVDRGMLGVHQPVGHIESHLVAFPQVHQRPGHGAVDAGGTCPPGRRYESANSRW